MAEDFAREAAAGQINLVVRHPGPLGSRVATKNGLEVVVVGLNHQAAPVSVRERLAFSPAARLEAQTRLLRRSVENVILSTCNRTELYAVIPAERGAGLSVECFLGDFHGLSQEAFTHYLYRHSGMDAVEHLFAVASGLDSMILGEPQILGQVREAYETAACCRAAGPVLSRVFHHALKVGKRVRSETAVSRYAVSVSFASVELARKVLGGLAERRVLLVGAGKMGELAARTLVDNGVTDVMVANRTLATAEALAERFGGQAADLSRLPELVAAADVVITSTGAPDFVLTETLVRTAMLGRGGPLFVVDIAVPRDVDPRVANIEGVFLYDIDDLQSVCTANLEERRKEAALARQIVVAEAAEFAEWWEGLAIVPTISALRHRMEEIRRAELERALGRIGGLSERERTTLEAMTSAIVNKMLHHPITRLKARGGACEGAEYARLVRELFALDGPADASLGERN